VNQKREILIGLVGEDGFARGNIWRLTAKSTDFYLDIDGRYGGGLHLSIHGANSCFTTHRFHIKADRMATARKKGVYLEHDIGRGVAFEGVKIAEDTYLVARLRFLWHLQRERYAEVARTRGKLSALDDFRSGGALYDPLEPNTAWDIDIIASYQRPYWPHARQSRRKGARIGALSNEADMWLTATSYQRSLTIHPTPWYLDLALPKPGEPSQSGLISGLGAGEHEQMYWFVESITSRPPAIRQGPKEQ
jgi:hypothetical protein